MRLSEFPWLRRSRLDDVIAFLSPLPARDDVVPEVRIIAGRGARQGFHAEFGRQVRGWLRVGMRAPQRCDYHIPVDELIARVAYGRSPRAPKGVVLPQAIEREIDAAVEALSIRKGPFLGTLEPEMIRRLTSYSQNARWEDVLAFRQRREGGYRVSLECPFPNQAGHKTPLKEVSVGRVDGLDEIPDFGVPHHVLDVLPNIGERLAVSVINKGRDLQFVGPLGVASAPIVAVREH